MKQVKFGAYKYQTGNIGDNIQTLAILRFVTKVDYYFDRDKINSTKINPQDQVKLIANGWYMHHRNGVFDWPPEDPNLQPLLISMYLERDVESNRADLAFFTEKSRAFLKKFGPVGARDEGTKDFLEKNGIEAYYSGCLTLTLLPDATIPKNDYILAIDISDELYQYVKKKTKRLLIRMNTYVGNDLTNEQKIVIAKYWLALYQSAHAVITSRLHAMLPCLALQTPVLAVRKEDQHRFEGLIELVNSASEKEIISGKYQYNFDNPRNNPKTYLQYADRLSKSCKDFTGYDSQKSFLNGQTYAEFLNSPEFAKTMAQIVDKTAVAYCHTAIRKQLEEEVNGQREKINKLEIENSELRQPGIKQSLNYLRLALQKRIRHQ